MGHLGLRFDPPQTKCWEQVIKSRQIGGTPHIKLAQSKVVIQQDFQQLQVRGAAVQSNRCEARKARPKLCI